MVKTSSSSENEACCSKSCKKNTDSLNSKITELTDKLSDSKNMLFHYKLALSQVEGRLVEFKNQEIKFCEKLKVLEFKVESKIDRIEYLTNKLEMLKKEKGDLDSKLTGFQTASKDLDNLLEIQRSDKNKEGLGYSVVPPLLLKPSPAIENNSDDLQNKNPSITETGASSSTILSKPTINFMKAAERPTESKTDKVKTAKNPTVKYVELYRKTSKRSNVRGNQRNWNNLKSQQLGKNFVMKKVCYNYGGVDHLSCDCDLWMKRGKSSPRNNYTYKSMPPRPATHKSYRPPMRPIRPNMNAAQLKRTSFYKPTHSYAQRPFQGKSTNRTQFQALRVSIVCCCCSR
nr:hypothetical protein [Tanacetum cinerariifolium]GEX07237.1 hypothetical protein [Tanacetum cinerariifolium]